MSQDLAHLSPPLPASPQGAPSLLLDHITDMAAQLKLARKEITQVIFGQEGVIDSCLISVLAGGHALLVGVPGLAKTRLVETIGQVFSLHGARIQCTPDLMPADILGAEVLEETELGRRHFRFLPGPVFCQLLMADEINRASPRTQSALLQAMQEGRISIAGQDRPLPKPFHVLATQNPIEQEGTYPLPEAQLDRFLLQIDVPYPSRQAEAAMLLATTGHTLPTTRSILTSQTLLDAQALVRQLPVGEQLLHLILRLVRAARPVMPGMGEDDRQAGIAPDQTAAEQKWISHYLAWGPGPRASQALLLAAKARALLEGRFAPAPQDVLALARPILQHRMGLSYAARAEGVSVEDVITQLLEKL
jgi:MoxR-like ATPase